jgi:hypothetical protein
MNEDLRKEIVEKIVENSGGMSVTYPAPFPFYI